jgi:autotransporter-associated beta strand protein
MTGGYRVDENGILNLNNAGGVTGDLTLNGGTLQLEVSSIFSHPIILTAHSIIDVCGHGVILSGAILGGAYNLSVIDSVGGGSISFNSNCVRESSYTGTTTFGSGETAVVHPTQIPASSSSTTGFDVNLGITVEQSEQISGDGGVLIKLGQGTLILDSHDSEHLNNYAGGTVIKDGTVEIDYSDELSSGPVKFLALNDSSRPVLKAGGNVTVSNPVGLTTVGYVDTNGHDMTMSSYVYGGGDLHKIGDGSVAITEAYNLGNVQHINLLSGGLHIKGTPGSTVVSAKPIHLGGFCNQS